MFHSARIKLTAWYLTIIMILSIMFSVAIYHVLTQEIERFERSARFRIERRLQEDPGISDNLRPRRTPTPLPISLELIEETKQRILFMLLLVNIGVCLSAGAFGFILAGRTLAPIQTMVEEQYRFVSDASHELRTPLTSLKSAFEVYLRQKDFQSSDARTLVRESLQEVDKLQSLSESLLELAQYQHSKNTFPVSELSITVVIDDAIHNVSALAKKKHIIFTKHIQEARMLGNKEKLTGLFVILLDNAIKYSHHASSISVSSQRVDGSLAVSVRDTGIGIRDQDLPHIFERFYRADAARSTAKTDGYGLGLAIAKKIVTLHHGTIDVQSSIAKGTTLTVRLPFVFS